MPIRYDYANVDQRTIDEHWDDLRPIVEALMVIGIGKITADTLPEIILRNEVWPMFAPDTAAGIDVHDIDLHWKRWIGLTTNATTVSRHQWLKRALPAIERSIAHRLAS